MRLLRITLEGFKSFADFTKVDFGKGITCIVGPNGCGKSNIVDAVRWVLGELNPRTLRGKSMTDVIFHGNRYRKPAAVAEVCLTFLDDDGILGAHRILSSEVGIFVEPASAISVAGLLERAGAGAIPKDSTVVLTVTGHGLKDPQWALRAADGSDVQPTVVGVDPAEVASVLGLAKA